MTSRHLIDPQLLPALDLLPGMDCTAAGIVAARARLAGAYQVMAGGDQSGPDIECHECLVAGWEGAPDVRLLLYTSPGSRPATGRPVYLYIHGGGFVLGTADMAARNCRHLAATLDCLVAAVDYRLAPETTFPGNLDDCYAALKWLHDNAASIGGDPKRIAIGGESAGGGLTAALALLARDRGEVPIIHQQLIYPMLDDRSAGEPSPFAGEFGWTAEQNRFSWRCLLDREPGDGDVSPYAAAARATSLEGLPPTFIGVGALDLLLEEDLEYGRRLIRAGVPVELHVYPGAFHGSDLVADAEVTRMHARDQVDALRRAFARGSV